VLSYGDIPDKANDYSPANLLMPRGAIINGNLDEIHPSTCAIRAGAGIRAPQLVQVRRRARACTLGRRDRARHELGKNAKGTRPASRN
jgi:hypothetical protein